MGHRCCSKQRVKRGLWSPEEDEKLITHITTYGHGNWSSVPKLAGLQRCGKSCRLRWINYLRPDLKKGSFTQEEEQIIIDVHRILGNRWAQIAKHLPGRTDNEVKNFWNSCIKKKLISRGLDPQTHNLISSSSHQTQLSDKKSSTSTTSFVVSHENQKQPISAFSMNSTVHEKRKYISPSLISPPYNDLQPIEISTVDQYKGPIVGIANPRNSATWTVRDQINNSSQDRQYYYGSSSMVHSTPNVSSSSSSSVDIHQPRIKSGNLIDELGTWDSSFHPFEAPKTISEAENQKSLQGHFNNDHQRQQPQENGEKTWETQNDLTFESYSFDHAFMESALMSEALMSETLMCNDLSSAQYDLEWNYY